MSALRQTTPPADPPSVAALSATSREVLEAIRDAYTFVDRADEAVALGIVAQRPDVAAVLIAALPHVRQIFGDSTPVWLISVDDHTGGPITLSARIKSSGSVSEQFAMRDAFYRTWWNEASATVLGDLSFGV